MTFNSSIQQTADGVTNAVATGAITSPFWIPHLHSLSEIAAIITPLLGGVWLAVQIWAKVHEVKNRNKK